MLRTTFVSLLLASVAVWCVAPSQSTGAAEIAQPAPPELGRAIEPFVLRDYRGREHTLAEYDDRPLLVLAVIGTECPLARLYGPRLAQLAEEYGPRGVAFLGLSPNQQDSVTKLAAYARAHGIEFPILKDLGNVVADQIGAQRTPEVFVLDAQRRIRYWGRIDDQYGLSDRLVGYQLPEPRRRDLAIALDELLADQPVSQPVTTAPGCLIGRVRQPAADADVTYARDIAPIFNQHCVSCHREGQIGPFPLTNHDEAVGWAEMIREVVDQRRMPPWHADPHYGEFINDARLSDDELAAIGRWVEAGAPLGDPADLPAPPEFPTGWMIPEPDVVINMRDEPYTVPAEGTVEYQRFVVDPGWTEDKWIKAIEPRPGNPAVVHHVVMYLIPPRGPNTGAAGRLRTDWLAAYAPGLRPQVLPDGIARFAPAGSRLVFELHYTPNGVEQDDLSYLGIVFADPASVRKELAVKNAGNFSFRIPAHDPNYRVESRFRFRENTLLWSVSPHMHLRGKDFLYKVLYPDGREETVLWVPQYDFAWQTTYVFTEPKYLPKGSELFCVAHFDNSADNLNNPDPSLDVTWGEQTWQEMMFGWFEMALADQDLTLPQPEPLGRVKEYLAAVEAGAIQVDGQMREVAAKGLDDEETFRFFAYYLQELVPQIDRVCVTYNDAGKLRAQAVEELNELDTPLGTTTASTLADGQALAEALSARGPVVCDDLGQAEGSLARRFFRRGVISSVHFPVEIDGRPMTVNFWSTDPAAFPPEAVQTLAEVVAALVGGR